MWTDSPALDGLPSEVWLWFGASPICSRPLAKTAKGAPVATKVVHVSDPAGRAAEDEGHLGPLVVLEHPDIGEPATLEVFPDEVADLENAERLVRLGDDPPGGARAPQGPVTAA